MAGSEVRLVDLMFGGEPRSIVASLLRTSSGIVVVDPGPTSTLGVLEHALGRIHATWQDVRAVLLTHLHLDHAGSAGSIAGSNPDIKVYVHAFGAPHLADPTRLLRSAERIYGDELHTLWGAVLPAPAGQIVPLVGGETLRVDGRAFAVAATPGHARHHVSFLDAGSGTAFVGDAAGVRISGADPVVPVTPPPDIDLDAWREGVDRIRAWDPARLLLTHFGGVTDPAEHLDLHQAALDAWEARVRADLRASADDTDAAMAARFATEVAADLSRRVGEPTADEYLRSVGPEDCWRGLARYCRL